MKNFKFWVPPTVGALLTPIFILAALRSAGAGHGSYFSAIAFYPVPMIFLMLNPIGIENDAFLPR